MKRLLLLALGVLLLGACGPSPSTLATMTPIPRTPRPTATMTLTPTPTGTPYPTPTTAWGTGSAPRIGIWSEGDPMHCAEWDTDDAKYVGTSLDWSYTTLPGIYQWWTLCVSGGSVMIDFDVSAHAEGGAIIAVAGSAGLFTVTETTDLAGDCDIWDQSGSAIVTVAPGTYQLSNYAGAYVAHDCGSASVTQVEQIQPLAPGPINPTPTPAAGIWITEVLARPQGATCPDWNLRAGCGNNDQYIEVAAVPAQSLAGYTLGVDGVGAYTIKSDNYSGPLKVFFADMWPNWGPSFTFPITGTARLTNTLGANVDIRAFQTIPGLSWAAQYWTQPTGVWWYFSPSPGN